MPVPAVTPAGKFTLSAGSTSAIHDAADPLGGVDRAAAADRDQAVAAFRLVITSPGIDERNSGIRPHLVVANRIQSGGSKRLERLVQQPGFHDPLVGDDQRPLDVK